MLMGLEFFTVEDVRIKAETNGHYISKVTAEKIATIAQDKVGKSDVFFDVYWNIIDSAMKEYFDGLMEEVTNG